MTNIPARCPSCAHEMVVTELSCTNCDTAIVGHYPLSAFALLSEESLGFLETFVRLRGNVKEMERETEISYWSIRNTLDKVIVEMGFDAPSDEASQATQRKDILKRLSAGEIEVADATAMLKALGNE